MAHVPSPAEWKDELRWQQVTSHDHSTWSLPTISDSSVTYHGFWQPPVGWRWPCCLQVSSWQNIKYLLTINERNSTLGTIYKPSHEEEGNLLIPKKRPTDLYLPLLTMANKIIGGCIRTPYPDVFCRYNDWIKNLYGLRSRVHPFGNYVEHQEREVSTGHVAIFNLNQSVETQDWI